MRFYCTIGTQPQTQALSERSLRTGILHHAQPQMQRRRSSGARLLRHAQVHTGGNSVLVLYSFCAHLPSCSGCLLQINRTVHSKLTPSLHVPYQGRLAHRCRGGPFRQGSFTARQAGDCMATLYRVPVLLQMCTAFVLTCGC